MSAKGHKRGQMRTVLAVKLLLSNFSVAATRTQENHECYSLSYVQAYSAMYRIKYSSSCTKFLHNAARMSTNVCHSMCKALWILSQMWSASLYQSLFASSICCRPTAAVLISLWRDLYFSCCKADDAQQCSKSMNNHGNTAKWCCVCSISQTRASSQSCVRH